MKSKDLKSQSAAELKDSVKKMNEELFQLKLKNTTGQLEKKSQIRIVRREVARAQTALSALKKVTA